MRRLAKVFLILVAGVLAAIAWAGGAGETTATARLSTQLTPLQQKLMSGFASRALEQRSAQGLAARVGGMRRRHGRGERGRVSGESREQRACEPELPESHRS